MGRRQRIRMRKIKCARNITYLDSDPMVIKLKQWMSRYQWKNVKFLKLAFFGNTDRGILSTKNLEGGETLMEILYDVMITYTTVQKSFAENPVIVDELKMHELLSVFLVIERHKGEHSEWKSYIESMPRTVPFLPWLASKSEICMLPADFQFVLLKKRESFESSWERLRKSINSRWKCECCQTPGNRVITLNSFTWAYVIVNTRAVYVDPTIVRKLSAVASNKMLSDEPCMALCPYLDMFNHSDLARTEANLVEHNGKWIYRLVTLSPSTSHKEVFISYGPHDNTKLLCEYGFFIAKNEFDIVTFGLHEILNITNISLNEKQYKFITAHKFNESLYCSNNGPSFNLQAVLFVMLSSRSNWCFYIFGSYLREDLKKIKELTKKILNYKLSKTESIVFQLNAVSISESLKVVIDYFNCYLIALKVLCATLV
ncbi:hypothetical protein FQA39_LY15376 [Lamprigera yunnana]|nr:hypothetical protein FQA39_LY15376 [Lamprigera yunnana]